MNVYIAMLNHQRVLLLLAVDVSDSPCTHRSALKVFGWKAFIDWDHEEMENKTSSKFQFGQKSIMIIRFVLTFPPPFLDQCQL